ncbi:defensin-like protein 1 [Pyrus x bretschneideri]|uniref:defensin-like protein 1 n=1 Tax=Pyrus x bretschneideri TaxID=225117 RepID=UPI0005110753|nr:defensin-like protein 1 [Pyrus x bretschneideri]
MEPSMRFVSAAFILILLLATTEMGPMAVEGRSGMTSKGAAEKKTCDSHPSSKFKGVCFFTNNCVDTCKLEGSSGGQCRGFRRICICTKQC